MKTTHKLLALALISCGGLFAQAPAPVAVYNPASYTKPNYPNAGIAQGSIFVVYGTNLGPGTLAQAQSLPLPTTTGVGGTTVQITVGGTTVTAPMVYSLATQIAGVVPSSVPVGTGTLTVTFNGQSGSLPIQVVKSNFGISTINQTGGGPAVVTFPNYSVVTTTNSAKPGDTLLLWGTGLGPITGSDADVPAGGNLDAPVQVFVGGVAATVTYHGRSADPGLDQINFVVPPGVTGCYVTVVVQTGNTVSNNPTISISPNGGPCSDANGISLSSPAISSALAANGHINIGSVLLIEESFNISLFGQSINTTTTGASATFTRFTAAQLATTPSLFGIPSVGSCTVSTFNGTNPSNPAAAHALGLDAGTAISLTPPSGSAISLTQSGGDKGVYTAPSKALASLATGTYMISGSGGADVGAFNTTLNLTAPLTWTNKTQITTTSTGLPGTVNRSGTPATTLTWSGGDPNAFAVIAGFSTGGTGSNSLGGFFLCIAPISAQQFTVPSSAMLALPPTATDGIGVLMLGSTTTPQMFTANGLDFGFAAASTISGSSVVYQ
jgi:uncharacterized protein (TIGR03437 family)